MGTKRIKHPASIMQTERECFICKRTQPLHKHHIYGGGARLLSEQHGFWVWLCPDHHTGDHGVHNDEYANLWLKRTCQATYEATHSHEEFMHIIGKNYMEVKL